MSLFPDRVKICRTSKGLTQKQAGEFLGLAIRTWQDYEAGKRSPATLDALIQIADFFNVSIDWLVGRTNNPKINR